MTIHVHPSLENPLGIVELKTTKTNTISKRWNDTGVDANTFFDFAVLSFNNFFDFAVLSVNNFFDFAVLSVVFFCFLEGVGREDGEERSWERFPVESMFEKLKPESEFNVQAQPRLAG